jgi:hypothetical protein
MSDENPDFISRIESISRNYTGDEWTPQRALQDWPLYDPAYRSSVLVDFDAELARIDTSDLRKYSELTALRQRMDDMHHAMRKAGR